MATPRLYKRVFASLLLLSLVCALLVGFRWSATSSDSEPIMVGVMHSLKGTMSAEETPIAAVTMFAIAEINAAGGLLGRQVEAILRDGGSNPQQFAQIAEELTQVHEVDAVFGCWTSACRKAVKPVFESENNLLFYPVQYEGLESSENIVYLGPVPNQQMIPAFYWARENFGGKIYLVGSDYIFPRAANLILSGYKGMVDASIVGESYIPLGSTDVNHIIDDIMQSKPDVIFNTINGSSNVAFFNALQNAGINANTIPVISFSVDENSLDQIHRANKAALHKHYVASSYFQSLNTPGNQAFVSQVLTHFSDNLSYPVNNVSAAMVAAYVGVHLWADTVRNAQSTDPVTVRRHLGKMYRIAPNGPVLVDEQNGHLWQHTYIGQINTDNQLVIPLQANKKSSLTRSVDNEWQIRIVWQSDKTIHPVPYPKIHTENEWNAWVNEQYGEKIATQGTP